MAPARCLLAAALSAALAASALTDHESVCSSSGECAFEGRRANANTMLQVTRGSTLMEMPGVASHAGASGQLSLSGGLLPQSGGGRRTPQQAAAMKSELAHLQETVLKAMGSQGSPHDNTTQAFVDMVRKMANTLSANLLEFSNQSQALLYQLHSEFGGCASKTNATLETYESAFQAAQALHQVCAPEEKTMKQEAERCRENTGVLAENKQLKCAALESDARATPRSPICVDTPGETYKEWLTKNAALLSTMLQNYQEKDEACTQATQVHKTNASSCSQVEQKAEEAGVKCKGLAKAMDEASCSVWTHRTSTCEVQSTCYSQALAGYNAAVETVEIEESELKHNAYVLEHIKCLLRLLDTDAKGNGHDAQACLDKTVDTSALDIHYPPAPPPDACQLPASYPCTKDYLDAHYGSTPELRQRCIPCAAGAEAAPAPAPAHASIRARTAADVHSLPAPAPAPLSSGALPSEENGGSAGQKSYTTPNGWIVSSDLPTFKWGKLYWLSNLVDGSEACRPSSCSTRSAQHGGSANCYWLGQGSWTADSYLEVRMDEARYVDHVALEPTGRVDSRVTHFRVLADGQDVTPPTFDEDLAAYNAGTKYDRIGVLTPSGAACDSMLHVNIKAVVRTVRLVELTKGGSYCAFGEIRLMGRKSQSP